MNVVFIPGQLFTYRGKRRLLRRQSGAGQVLGREPAHDIVFVRIFDVSGDVLTPLIGFLPVTSAAYTASKVSIVEQIPLPDGWEALRDEWRAEWRAGEAGVFSLPLHEITADSLETVDYLKDGGVIELAFPRRSASGRFDKIVAYVSGASRA